MTQPGLSQIVTNRHKYLPTTDLEWVWQDGSRWVGFSANLVPKQTGKLEDRAPSLTDNDFNTQLDAALDGLTLEQWQCPTPITSCGRCGI